MISRDGFKVSIFKAKAKATFVVKVKGSRSSKTPSLVVKVSDMM